ncbi:hypothetical protein [uncultured Ferrovibrio sp.]|jgi:hypothetical protein|uniref:hypothetical protein n=1 Tax=uncultured Ferrovibrio sp. TaxID=1576913 RepID=UPI00262E8333|nr:hypothetical protein [uncultured Ferrovibrio sp.]
MQVNDWTIDVSAKIVENEDYLVSLCEDGNGYEVAFIRRKRPSLLAGMDKIVEREALIAFRQAMRASAARRWS